MSRLWSLVHRAHFCERGEIFARDEHVIFGEIFIFNSLIFCTWHQWTDNLRTAIIMKGSKSWIASHCINYVCNSFQQFRVWKYCVEISSTITRTCARLRTLEYKLWCPQQSTSIIWYVTATVIPSSHPPGPGHILWSIFYILWQIVTVHGGSWGATFVYFLRPVWLCVIKSCSPRNSTPHIITWWWWYNIWCACGRDGMCK